jgi:peptidoglycan biosynthesis protein MviN/MurJ (putative lipid II flippase)
MSGARAAGSPNRWSGMESTSVLELSSPAPAGESVGGSRALRSKHARAGKAMAIATLTMAGASGIQALVYLSSFGVNGRTDGFFAAFAVYATFGVFSQSIRVTAAPALVGSRPRFTTAQFCAALALIGLGVMIVTGPLAGPAARLLAPGLPASERALTSSALPILGVAMVLQLWAAGGATILSGRNRFLPVAWAYGLGALAGLAAYLPAERAAGELALGWSMLAMAVVTFALVAAALRPSPSGLRGSLPSPREVVVVTASLLGRTGVYLAFNSLYLVTLAFASHGDAGDTTVLSYAYLFVSYLVAGTGFALGMARISDMARGAQAAWHDVVGDTVPPGFRYAMLICAPAVAGLVAFGAPIAGALFPASFTDAHVETLRLFAGLLLPWLVGALLVNLMLPALFALGRVRLANLLAVPMIALQLLASAIGAAVAGAAGTVAAFGVAPLAFALMMLVLEGGQRRGAIARELARDGLRFAGIAAASFGGVAALVSILPESHGVATMAVGGLLGALLYGGALNVAAPRQLRVLLRGSSVEAEA